MGQPSEESLLREQIEYYRARAGEYDEWFGRRGRYDRGPALNARWFAQVEQVRAALNAFRPVGRVLELACGTGLWTQQLLAHAERITAVDASAEVLAINAQRLRSDKVRYVEADLFGWQPDGLYDMVFLGFWLSHVPPERFESFWDLVGRALAPGGRAFLVDSLYEPTSGATDHRLADPRDTVAERRLNDGRVFHIVKIFYEPDELQDRLRQMGWEARVWRTANYFLYGWARAAGERGEGRGTSEE